MAPKKRGGSATAKSNPKKEKNLTTTNAVEEPKQEEKPHSDNVEEDPPTKKVRRSGRNASSNGEVEMEKKEVNAKVVVQKKEVNAKVVAQKKELNDQVAVENNGAENRSKTRDIVVEHCKQCQCFKVRASKVEKELKGAIPDVEVTINPEKPRRGCFEIRDGKGTIFLSLQDMPRPFTKLKQWDLDGTISEIIEKIK